MERVSTELQEAWRDLNHPPVGCVRCHKTVHLDGGLVSWRCESCGHLVCKDCCLTQPGYRLGEKPWEQWEQDPAPGGREYYAATLCSQVCWVRAGSPEE